MPENLLILGIQQESDVMVATHSVSRMTKNIGMTTTESTLCATVVSELATNIIRYAELGEIALKYDDDTLHIIAKDKGPGIKDIALARQEGYSSGSGLGMGLSGVARIMDTMEIESTPNQGTCITTTKAVRLKDSNLSSKKTRKQTFDMAYRLNPLPGEEVSGDGVLLVEVSDYQCMALWDVSGHGAEAHALSKKIKSFLRPLCHQPPHSILTQVHKKFLGTRGLVAVIARINHNSGWVEYAGVGNVTLVHCHAQGRRRLSLQEGVMGYQIRTPKLERLQLNDGDTLIMHSDGIATIRDNLTIQRHTKATELVNTLLLNHRSAQADDASCVVLRYKKS